MGVYDALYEVEAASASCASLAEEVAEENNGLGLEYSDGIGVGVIEARVAGKVVESTSGAGFGVEGGVDKAAYAGGVERAGTHGAGFEGCVEGTVGEAPTTEFAGGATEGEELGVGRWISQGLALVVGRREDLSVSSDYCANGYLSLLGGQRCLFQGAPHQVEVPCIFGIRRLGLFWPAVAAGFAIRFNFFGHGADDSNAARYDQRAERVGTRLEPVPGEVPQEPLGHLRARRVVGAQEQHLRSGFWLHHCLDLPPSGSSPP